MKIRELQDIIEERSPLCLQEEWDNSGLQINAGTDDIDRILVAREITSKVIDEAISRRVNMIVTHHPLIFGSLKKVDGNDITGNFIIKLIKANISVYASHTPFDKCRGGNNDYLASMLHLLDVRPMDTDDQGYCREGIVDGQCNIAEYTHQISQWLDIDKSKMAFTGIPSHMVEKVGLCTGAGSQFMYAAKKAGCDLFITGDVKYHTAQTAKEMGLNLLDIGHYGSEKIFVENMASYLRQKTEVEIISSKENLDPFDYI